jgi:hypothetical protein
MVFEGKRNTMFVVYLTTLHLFSRFRRDKEINDKGWRLLKEQQYQ